MLCSVLALLLSVACRDTPFTPNAAEPASPAVRVLGADTLIARTDFSEYAVSETTGVHPSDWTERWKATGVNWKVWADSSGDFQGDAKMRNNIWGSNARHAVSWDVVRTPSDVRLHTRVRLSTNVGGMLAGLVVAGGGSGHSTSTGYEFHLENYNGHFGVELIRFVNGQWVELGYHPFPFQADSFYHLVLEKQGSALRAMVWKDGEAEPNNWQIEAIDTVLTSGWVGFANYTSSGKFEYDFLEVYDPNANPVPAQVPDTIPAWIYASENLVPFLGDTTYMMVRNVVSVRFQFGATQAERQAAIDLVDGEVVGGHPFMEPLEGYYYVRISGDSTGEAAGQAATALQTLPQVAGASIVLVHPDEWIRLWRLPDDALDFQRENWSLRFDPNATSELWTHEILDARFAWGCDTGSVAVPIAVVDDGFRLLDDLEGNVEKVEGFPPLEEDDPNQHHGTMVASILGAEGNNGMGIAGMMWGARLRLYDWFYDPQTGLRRPVGFEGRAAVMDRIGQAGLEGARVINLSVGAPYPEGYRPGTDPARLVKDDSLARVWARDLRITLRQLAAAGRQPFLVIGAGNHGEDASWSGLPRLAGEPEFEDQILVVGGIQRNLADPSQIEPWQDIADRGATAVGPLVHIAAPAEVPALTGTGGVLIMPGTSAATPMATGVVGLLLSFNPNLTNQQIKDFVLEGAARSNRTVGGVPVLNAYESLKRAAEELDAPLCGNRVWAADGQIHARRTATVVEPLAPLASQPVGQVEPLHGGKEIVYLTMQGRRMLAWNEDGSWTEVPFPPPDGEARRGGTTASVFGRSHDRAPERDSMAFVDDSVVSNTFWYRTQSSAEAPVILRPPSVADDTVAHMTVQDTLGPVQVTCLERDPSSGFCYFSIIENRTWFFRLGYPQIGTEAYVTVSPMHHVEVDSTAWAPCSFDPSHECREVQSLQEQQGAQVYTVDLGSGAVEPVESFAEDMVFWIGQAETGESVVLGRGLWHITFWADPALYYQTGDPFHDFEQTLTRCSIEYWQQSGFAFSETIPTPHTCNFGDTSFPSQGAGGGTIAPNLVPESPRLSLGGEPTGGAVSVPMPFFGPDGDAIESLSP